MQKTEARGLHSCRKGGAVRIGKILSSTRERAGMSQKQLGKKLGTSASRISRMEAEVTPLTEPEIVKYLRAIGTPESEGVRKYVGEKWNKLKKPDYFHPSRKALRIAESCFQRIDELKTDIDRNSVFYKQLNFHEQTVKELSGYVESREHTIAWIGSIGVGKTTAICGLMGLKDDGKPVLHTGGGRSTVCEVRIKRGPQVGVVVEPLTEDEVYKYVYEFCDYLIVTTSHDADEREALDLQGMSLSREVERCVRNMSELTVKRFKGEKGYEQQDKAIDLVNKLRESHSGTTKELADELKIQVLLKLNLDQRK